MGEKVHLASLKSILQNSLFYYEHFVGYFESIKVTVAKILAKTFIRRLCNRLYGIGYSIFSTLELILCQWKVTLPRYTENVFRRLWNGFYRNNVFFNTLKAILSWSKLPLPRYGWKRSFSGSKTGVTAYTVLFLALWRLFWVDKKYHCQDTGKNVLSKALKQVLQY